MSDRYGYIGIETLLNFCENSKDHAVTPNDFMRMARVRVPERKLGRWEMKPDPYGFFDEIPVCSECGCMTKMRETYNFCPNCGADMREGEQE